jgi:hypothetical protein
LKKLAQADLRTVAKAFSPPKRPLRGITKPCLNQVCASLSISADDAKNVHAIEGLTFPIQPH